jgi:hypothetical protein
MTCSYNNNPYLFVTNAPVSTCQLRRLSLANLYSLVQYLWAVPTGVEPHTVPILSPDLTYKHQAKKLRLAVVKHPYLFVQGDNVIKTFAAVSYEFL